MVRSHWLSSLRVWLKASRPQRSRWTRKSLASIVDVSLLETRTLYSGVVAETESDHLHRLSEGGLEYCAIPPVDPNDLQLSSDVFAGAAQGPFPDTDTFKLHSRPSATKVIYLDFDGYITTGTAWNSATRPTITTPEFTLDGVAGFSPAEHTAMQLAWQRVAESFSPFDVDVTTEDPGVEALRNTGGGDVNWGIRVAIGGDSNGVLGISAGGVAFIGSFNWNSDTPTFVFPDSLARTEKYIADATSHEVGHTLGLVHDGLLPNTGYYTGHGTGATGWAPIMGVGYSKSLVQWSKGEYPGADNSEDDLNKITTQNGFTYRVDDHGNNQGAATAVTAAGNGDVSTAGVIEQNSDTDWFRFLASGDVNLQIDPAVRSPMLDILAELYDSNGNLVASSNPTNALNATITTNVPVGYYYLKIDGVGKAANGTDFGYSDYASLGQFTITGNVGDNFPPVVNDQTFSVPENSALGTAIGTVAATDPDVGDTFTFAITGGDPGNVFAINPTTGALTLNGPVDRETTPQYQITVTVTDLRGLSDTGVITIDISDVNEPPSVPDQAFSVLEKSAIGTNVGFVNVNDPDIAQAKSFSITGGNIGNAFAIDVGTGRITVNNPAAVDFNLIQTFNLTVRVIDGGTPSLSATGAVTISVLQVNLPPQLADQSFLLAENSPVGTNVGTVVATDPNLNQTKTFSITGGNASGAFAINPTTGVLTVANAALLNFETTPTFSLTVRAVDNGVPPMGATATVTVSLTDANDPPRITPATFSVIEAAPVDTFVGTVTATDDDAGQTRTFSITGGNPGNAFKINATTGAISVNTSAAVDWETTPVFSLRVTATDNGSPAAASTTTITINVINVNDAPTGVTFQNSASPLAENSANLNRVKVADIVVVDDGLGSNALSLTGADAGIFEIVGTGLYVKSGTELNFEAKPTFVVTVNAEDVTLGGAPDASGTYTLNLRDSNEAPVISNAVIRLVEKSPIGTVVASNFASDPDSGQMLKYAIEAGNRNNAFAINPVTGVITVNNPAALDYENEPPFELKIAVMDNGTPNLKTTAVLRIFLTDANDAPTVYRATKAIPENLPQGSVVLDYKVVAKDQDAGQKLTFAIVSGNTNNAFAIDPVTGLITVNNPQMMDYENQPPFELVISVQDNGTPSLGASAGLRIVLTNENDAPSVYNATASVFENAPVGSTVLDYKIVARDQDPGQSLTFAIVGGNRGDTFAINPATGLITVKNNSLLDFETGAPFDLTISTTDNGTPSRTSVANLRVNIKNVNEAPKITDASTTLFENSPAGTVVFDLKTTSTAPEPGQALKYQITAGNRQNAFAINPTTGVITVNNPAALDFETAAPFDLAVTVTDSVNAALTATGKLKVTLKDANDVPTIVNGDKTIPENTAAGTVVFDVKTIARDTDVGQSLQYAITAGNTGNAFAINPTTGVITVANAAAIDFETNPVFALKLSVTDNGVPAKSAIGTLTIRLTDLQEGPIVTPGTFSIPENSVAGTVVGTVVVSALPSGQTRAFAITGGNINNAFSINAAGQIVVNNPAALNFEVKPSFTLSVAVTDTGTTANTTTAGMVVNVINVNEPPVIAAQVFAVKTVTTAGTVVGTVTASDPDAGQSRSFAIVSGNGAFNDVFRINATTGQITVNNALAVFFTRQFDLGIRVTDSGSPALSATGVVRIYVNATGTVPARSLPSDSISTADAGANVIAVNTSPRGSSTDGDVLPLITKPKATTRTILSRLLPKKP